MRLFGGEAIKEIIFQKQGKNAVPFSEEDAEKWAEFKPHQTIRAQCYGVRKPRSLQQLRLFWACCRSVSSNTADENWDNSDKVANLCKIKLNFVDLNKTVVVGNKVYPHFRSIAFRNLGHIEACKFFDRAFEIMAKKLGVSVDDLLDNAEGDDGN